MSQYEEQFDSGILVRCGWDPPLQCYFAHLRDEAVDEDANPVIWVGTGLGGDPTTFDELVREFAQELDAEGYLPDGPDEGNRKGSIYLQFLHQHEKQLVADKEADR